MTIFENHQIMAPDLWLWRRQAVKEAISSQIEAIELDWLLQELLGLDNLTLRLESIPIGGSFSSPVSFDRLTKLWRDRIEMRIPVQYLAGKTPWRDFDLLVTPDVLIPRPETELTIDIVREYATPTHKAGIWVDLGTGSGAIAIGLARTMPQAQVAAVDTSTRALAIAKINADRWGLGDRISFHLGSWWSPLAHLQGQVSGMVSNPPYIPSATVLTLDPEVVNHEPHLALDGGEDGLDAIRLLVEEAPTYMISGGIWLIEIMTGQSTAVVELLTQSDRYTDIQSIDDLAGCDRFVRAQVK
jgi:release factor glutamine methyltransferase